MLLNVYYICYNKEGHLNLKIRIKKNKTKKLILVFYYIYNIITYNVKCFSLHEYIAFQLIISLKLIFKLSLS